MLLVSRGRIEASSGGWIAVLGWWGCGVLREFIMRLVNGGGVMAISVVTVRYALVVWRCGYFEAIFVHFESEAG